MTTGYIPTLAQVDELHRKIAQSQAAYDLIHGHCVVVADIARRMARRQNALFTRRCTLPDDAPEKAGDFGLRLTQDGNGSESFGMLRIPSVPSSDGLTGGTVPPRLIDEHLVVIGGLLHDIGTYFLLKQDGSDGGPLKFDGPNYVRHGLKGYEYLLNEGVDESIAQFARNHTGVGLTKEAVESQRRNPDVSDDVLELQAHLFGHGQLGVAALAFAAQFLLQRKHRLRARKRIERHAPFDHLDQVV